MKNRWTSMIGGAVICCAVSSSLSAQVAFPTEVKTLEDLKVVQDKIQKVVEKVRPATVALTSTQTGASGSGVIVNKDGLILTAAHVVQGHKEMSVIMPSGKAYKATVLGSNKTKDVAMLQMVKEKEWPFAELGNSYDLVIGSHVVTLGHAGGFDTVRPAPVRFGRLLSKNRQGFITTDSALIGGDSGGPLFDLNGKVVGINSSIGGTWLTNNHAGISSLVEDWDRLLKGDTWGQLNPNPLIDPDSPVMGFLPEETRGNRGVIVIEVLNGSPAKEAGFRVGDVLVALGSEKVSNARDLFVALNMHKPKDTIEVTLVRAGRAINLKVTLGRRADFSNE